MFVIKMNISMLQNLSSGIIDLEESQLYVFLTHKQMLCKKADLD